MKKLLILIFTPFLVLSQQSKINDQLFAQYENYKESSLTYKEFKHHHIVPLIEKLNNIEGFRTKKLGNSIQGRSISMISVGSGNTNVLLWSQMHGNESTATMAIFDIINYLKQNKAILNNLTLHFIPMLNPDGAEQFKRRNAIGIDINRDALKLQSPESKILKAARDSIDADFGFNLHDQSKYYNAEKTNKPATISYLAPAYDYEKNINQTRGNAMKIIVEMNEIIQQYAPGQVGRYSDEFEPRAFGDNIQKWGTSTILIESGGYQNDPQKQFIRKLNYVSILSAISSISTKKYESVSIKKYDDIPRNDIKLFDLKITNLSFLYLGKTYVVDLGINHIQGENKSNKHFKTTGAIQQIGDLSTHFGYETIDSENLVFNRAKTYPKILSNIDDLDQLNFKELLQQGYTAIAFDQIPEETYIENLPLKIISIKDIKITRDNSIPLPPIEYGKKPTFTLTKNNELYYAIIDGNVYNFTKEGN